MQWVRLDTAFPRNHKVLALLDHRDGRALGFVYCCGLSYAGEQGTDGFIPRAALPFLHAKPAEAQRLVEVGLWHDDEGGWLINDWEEYQPTSDETAKRSSDARFAARVRWEKARNAKSNANGNAGRTSGSQSTNERTDVLTDVSSTKATISPSQTRASARREESA